MFALVVYCLQAVWTTWPLVCDLSHRIPVRENRVVTVPFFNCWSLWWNADRAAAWFKDYWHAPIFFPFQQTFAWSEPQPALLVMAPIVWAGGSVFAAYNLYLLMSLVLNGMAAFYVLWQRRTGAIPALCGGLMLVWLPVSMRQFEVLQMIPIWPMILGWHFVARMAEEPCCRHAMLLTVSIVWQFCTSVHHGLFFLTVLVPASFVYTPSMCRPAFRKWTLIAACATALPLSCLLWPMRQSLTQMGFQREQQTVERLSVKPADLLLPPADAWIGGRRTKGFGVCPGWMKTVVAVFCTLMAFRCRAQRRWCAFLLVIAVNSAILSLGPHFKPAGIEVWPAISKSVPGLALARNIFRFSYLMQMSIIILAASGLGEMYRWCSIRFRPKYALTLTVIPSVLAVCETPPPPSVLSELPDLQSHRGWTAFAREKIPPGQAVATWPFSSGPSVSDYETTALWMIYGTMHGRPLLDGFSGFFPPKHRELQELVLQSGLSEAVLKRFAALGARFLIIYENVPRPPELLTSDRGKWRLNPVFQDPAGIEVFEILTPD